MRRKLLRAAQLGVLGKEMIQARRAGTEKKEQARQSVVDRLLSLHGLPQKIGQILSLGELEEEKAVYTRLTETPAEMTADEAFAEIEKALGRPWRECFAQLEKTGVGASLAQVHEGRLPDGRRVAVKVQYPWIGEALETDLHALGWLTAPVGGLRRGFDMRGYRREIGAMLREEMDYAHEADMLRRFAAVAEAAGSVEIPEVIEECSGEKILTMTWMEGERFGAVRKWPRERREEVAASLLRFFLLSGFVWRTLHADPHPGNYRFRMEKGRAVTGVLDFGCVKGLDAGVVSTLAALIDDTRSGALRATPGLALARYEALGFQRLLLTPLEPVLAELSAVLFEPFLQDRPFDMREWRMGERVEALLGELRWNFRIAGPPQMIFFMRAFQGLVQYLGALDAPVNWSAIYEPIARRVAKAGAPLAVDRAGAARGNWLSKALRIRVSRSGQIKADITFPASAAENLPDLLPEGVEAKLAGSAMDVAAMSRDLASRKFPAGELFSLEEGEKSFRVWLE
jgi:predicted unusual protein kinase regulating ubiquinone biosynthesis (AarF/ABC1/UbiB family)